MDLKEFIKLGLIDICQGVFEAKEVIGDNIAPTKVIADDNHSKNIYEVSKVEFDIATTAKENTGTSVNGGAKGGIIAVISAKLDATGHIENENQTVTRIKFSVPVVFSNKSS